MNTVNRETLRGEIERAINRVSAENDSNTPDFILSGFLMDCFDAFTLATLDRERWYGVPVSIENAHILRDALKGPKGGGA